MLRRALRLMNLIAIAITLVAMAPAVCAQAAGADASARILALESQGRAHPFEAAKALDALLPATPEHGAQRLELLTVQGLMLAVAAPPEAMEASAARLEAWGRDAQAPNAAAAAAAAILVRARSVARVGKLQRADLMMREAMVKLPAGTTPRDRYRFVAVHGYILDLTGQLEQAVRLNHEALALADAHGEVWQQSEARTELAYAYYGAKQLERARSLSLEAIALAVKVDDPVALGRAHNTAGIVLDGLGDQLGELSSFQIAIGNARRAGAKVDEVRYLANLADFFLKNGDYKTALSTAERALPLARELKDPNTQMVALANIGLAHISMQHLELGKRHVREAIAIDEARGSITGVSDTLQELGIYLEKAGDAAGAVAAYHQHRRLATTVLRDDQQKAILAMQEQYDADHRSRALVLLNRENDIKAEQLRRRDLQQRLWWLLAAAAALSFAVIALLVRRVRRTNLLLSSSNELLKVQGERDPLTGLANRRHFQAAMRRLAEDGKLSGTVYLIDIDHFKHINDRHGHGTGDAVLVEVSRRLRETLREDDLIVRWGGEEFLVVVQSLGAEQVDALAQRMLGVLDRTPVVAGAQRIAVTASIGFATFPIGPDLLRVPWERAINLVDTAMYLAKAHGRNRAYGVRLLQARDEAALEAITRSLESAWRDGQVALTLLQGRTALAVAA
ncbi:MAG: GGDEF domain-containing protein [Pseudomonadota bacterium]